jgi:hypothetical protein
MSREAATVLAQVRGDRAQLEKHFEALESVAIDADTDERTLAWVAWAAHHAYTAIESILERCSRFAGAPVPAGPASHRELLELAALDVPGARPALLRSAVADHLRELRTFRHFVRHGYGVELDWERMEFVRRRTLAAREELGRDLDGVEGWLGAMGQE